MLLGMVNAVAIGVLVALAIAPPRHMSAVAIAVSMIGLVLALPAGGIVGWAARRVEDRRLPTLLFVSLALVPLCGAIGVDITHEQVPTDSFYGIVVLASLPTAALTALLERTTRPPPPPEPRLPEARALRS
jgi:hypothetical protein